MQQGIRKSFIFQAAFILLPVLLLATYGLFSLRREKQLLEEENRDRCTIVVQSLARELPGQLVQLIEGYVAADRLQHVELRLAAGARIPNPSDLPPETLADIKSNEAEHLERFESANPQFKFDQQPFASVYYDGGKQRNHEPENGVPAVPEWFLELSDTQRQQFQAIESAIGGSRTDDALQLINQFIGESDDLEAKTYAGFMRRQLTDPPLNEWLGSAATSDPTLSPAGLPLSGLAMFHALELHETVPVDDETWAAFVSHFDQPPSVLTDTLLARVGRRVANDDPNAQDRFNALKQLVNRHRWTAAIVGQLTDEVPDERQPLQWLQLNPRKILIITDFAGGPETNRWLEQTIIPADWLIPQIKMAIADTAALLPDDVSLNLSLAGNTIPLSGNAAVSEIAASVASTEFVLGGLTRRVGAVAQLSVWLTGPVKMYQRHDQRVLMMSGLMAMAVVAAFFGLWQTFTNLRRQLALNEMKTNFVSSVSHELRAPIASVRLMAENLQQGKVSGEAKVTEYVGFIGQECRRLSSLIENVLDFSRIEQGRKQYELEPTDLARLVDDTVRLMNPYAQERNVSLSIESEGRLSSRPVTTDKPGDWRVAAPFAPIELNLDGRAVQQALINLIDNAIKHSPAGEQVEVLLQHVIGRDAVLLSVTDRGPGIPEDEQEKIFERFYRLGSELRRETQGIGIGLSIVKHIIDGHGGRVWVESKPGKGSRFVIELQPQMDADEHR